MNGSNIFFKGYTNDWKNTLSQFYQDLNMVLEKDRV